MGGGKLVRGSPVNTRKGWCPQPYQFELHLPAEMGVLYSAAEPERTLSGRSADAQRTPA